LQLTAGEFVVARQNSADGMAIRLTNQHLMAAGVLAAAAHRRRSPDLRCERHGIHRGRARSPVAETTAERAGRLMGLSLVMGTALGLVNLTANYSVASLDSRTHVRMSER
jgi:hypothetical protein